MHLRHGQTDTEMYILHLALKTVPIEDWGPTDHILNWDLNPLYFWILPVVIRGSGSVAQLHSNLTLTFEVWPLTLTLIPGELWSLSMHMLKVKVKATRFNS